MLRLYYACDEYRRIKNEFENICAKLYLFKEAEKKRWRQRNGESWKKLTFTGIFLWFSSRSVLFFRVYTCRVRSFAMLSFLVSFTRLTTERVRERKKDENKRKNGKCPIKWEEKVKTCVTRGSFHFSKCSSGDTFESKEIVFVFAVKYFHLTSFSEYTFSITEWYHRSIKYAPDSIFPSIFPKLNCVTELREKSISGIKRSQRLYVYECILPLPQSRGNRGK